MRKNAVQFHREHYGPSHPAINIKLYKGFEDGLRAFKQANPDTAPRFTEEWMRANLSEDDLQLWWENACQQGFERAEELAHEIFGAQVNVYSEGRSGGWLTVHGLKEVESWNAIDLAKWGKFQKIVKELVNDVPYQAVDMMYYNVFERMEQEQDKQLQTLQTV